MKIIDVLLAWFTDVYKRYGYGAVLVCLLVVAVIVASFMLLFGVTPAQMVRLIWGSN